jgi:hypothetical protein
MRYLVHEEKRPDYIFSHSAGIYSIAFTVANAFRVTNFAYVVYSQISFTGKQKGKRDALRNVLPCGKATVEDMERAVLEQNANLPEKSCKIFVDSLPISSLTSMKLKHRSL